MMEKLKSILSPGKGIDEELMYGSGRGSNPIVDRLSESNQPAGLHSSATSPPKPFNNGPQATAFSHDSKGPATDSQPTPDTHTSTTTAPSDASKADANLVATREADKLSPGETGRSSTNEGSSNLRPEYPAPVSAGSNASIKSNVIGRVPTGSTLTQDQGSPPAISASDGKFMNQSTLSRDQAPAGTHTFSSIQSGVSLYDSSESAPPHQTEPGKRLDSSLDPSSMSTMTAGHPSDAVDTHDHHYGRDALGAGAVGTGAYALSKSSDRHEKEPVQSLGSTSSNATPTVAATTSSNIVSRPVQSRGFTEDIKSKHMPGAWPQTPANESENTLGSDSAGVGSGAAVIAAQKAYGKHSADHSAPITASSTHRVEPTPYISSLDPRVDSGSAKRQDPARQAATAAATAGILGSAASAGRNKQSANQSDDPYSAQTMNADISRDSAPPAASTASQAYDATQGNHSERLYDTQRENVSAQKDYVSMAALTSAEPQGVPQGTLGEKLKEAEEKDDDGKNYALAGAAAAATGAGAYGLSQYSDRGESAKQTEAPPSVGERTAPVRATDQTLAEEPVFTSSAPPTLAQREPIDREFPLAGTQEQSHGLKPTNYSHSTTGQDPIAQSRETPVAHGKPTPKDAAENGASGAAGVVAYEALQREHAEPSAARSADFDDPLVSRAHPRALEGYDDQRAIPSHDVHHAGYEPARPESESTHDHRDTALLGAGAVGGGAAAGVLAAREQNDNKLEQERAKVAERKHDENEKQKKKEHESSRKSEEKSRPHSDEKQDKEHKHGLLHRILHRKSKDDVGREDEARRSTDKSRSSYEQPTPEKRPLSVGDQFDDHPRHPADGSSPVDSTSGAPEHSKHQGRNRLHKDPPPGYIEKKLHEQEATS